MTLLKFQKITIFLIIQAIVAAIAAVLGFNKGVAVSDYKYQAAVAEVKQQYEQEIEAARNAAEKVKIVYQDRVQVVKDVQVVVKERIKAAENKINSNCEVSTEAVDILNTASSGK